MNRLPFKPRTLGLIAAAVLVLVTVGLLTNRTPTPDPAKPVADGTASSARPSLTVAVVEAKRGLLPIKLAANGSVAAWQEASIGAEASGLRVAELHASVGDQVKKGQRLATFAAESVQADVALARATVAEAKANAQEALANGDRARAIQGSGAISAQQINQYLTQEQTAQARVASAKAQLDAQLLRLKQTQVLAPDSGIISSRSATVGSVLGAGAEMFRLIRQGRLEWRAEVTSAELGRLTAGTGVLVTAPGGAQVKGRVRTLAPTVDAATRNGLVYVDLLTGSLTAPKDSAPKGSAATSMAASFKPGMYARGEFELGQSAALSVPQTAVVVRDGFSYVYRVNPDNRVTQLKVQTGRILGEQIEIQSGVKPDDKLVASGGSFLSDGDLVRVGDAPKATAAAAAPTFKPNEALAHTVPAQAAIK